MTVVAHVQGLELSGLPPISVGLRERERGCELWIAAAGASPVEWENPGCAGLEIDGQRAKAVVERLLTLDAMLGDDLRSNRTVVKRIRPVGSQPVAVSFPPASPIDAYRSARPESSFLIRPLLLCKPMLDHLYPYQLEGVAWLKQREAGVLADDMGLGKTLQTITALQLLVGDGSVHDALVVAPKSLLGTWIHELGRWAPELSVSRMAPAPAVKDTAWAHVLGRFHVYLTHYEHLRELPQPFAAHEFGVIIADEAHRTRRTEAQSTQSIRDLKSGRWWALTGTPLERDARDFATLLSMIEPRRFAPSDGRLPQDTLRARARPYVLRRRKLEVLSQLPAVTEEIEWLELTPKQRDAYREVKQRTLRNRRDPGAFLNGLNELRQICDMDPVSGDSSKIDRIVGLVDMLDGLEEKGVVFSQLLKPLDELERRVRLEFGSRYARIDGSMDADAREKQLSRFREDRDVIVLLASSRVASEGLTLVEANHGIFLNEWWNPSSNLQARDRIVRIGQVRPVSIWKYRCEGTVEEGFDRLLRDKSELFERVIEGLGSSADISRNTIDVLASSL